MSRRRGRVPPLFIMIPWWVYVLTACASYAFLKYLAPDLAADAGYAAIGGLLALLGPIITIGLLLLAAARLYEGDAPDHSPPAPSGLSNEGECDKDDAGPDSSAKP